MVRNKFGQGWEIQDQTSFKYCSGTIVYSQFIETTQHPEYYRIEFTGSISEMNRPQIQTVRWLEMLRFHNRIMKLMEER